LFLGISDYAEAFAATIQKPLHFNILAEKNESRERCHNFRGPHLKPSAEKIRMGSEGWLCSAKCLEVALRDEVKNPISLV
jgi:hypothetical protein